MLALLQQPELHDGDRLSRDGFMRRWEQIPEFKQAELIEGVVYLASSVSLAHGSYDAIFVQWIGRHCFGVEQGLRVTTNTTLFLGDSTYQPDIALFRPTGNEGMGCEYLEQLPVLVIEISNSSKSDDLGPKLAAYRSAGLRDYITVLLEEQRVEWRVLSGSQYRLLQPQ